MKSIIYLLCWLVSSAVFSQAPLELRLSPQVLEAKELPFLERPGALALNTPYPEIKMLRTQLSQFLGKPLKFFTGWEPQGEAHVTTITPPELSRLSTHLSQARIDAIARSHDIQSADLKLIGLGSGKLLINNEQAETFFVIVTSQKLLKIRQVIQQEFVKNGGAEEVFDPQRFYPHITVGYTHRDIHESDGLIKDEAHSFDNRFSLRTAISSREK